MTMDRYEHLAHQERRLYEAVPPIEPGNQYWLDSDAGPSYCSKCVDIARGREFELGQPLEDRWSYEQTPMERAFYAGIDGGFETSGEDSTKACEICGCTLHYTLSDYGLEEELAYYAEQPGFAVVGPEETYAISRVCLNLTWGGAPADQVEAAITIVEEALKTIIENGVRS